MLVIKELISVLRSLTEMLPSALSAPPPSDPPRLRVGLGGDIPVAPILATVLLVSGGLLASCVTGICGAIFPYILPKKYCLPARLVSSLTVVIVGTKTKRECDAALDEAGTRAAFSPVPSVADTGPYAYCRNPMYWAILSLPAAIGLAADNAWVAIGSNIVLWLYLHFVVVPAEEAFLQKQLVGEAYKKYCASVKRWGFF